MGRKRGAGAGPGEDGGAAVLDRPKVGAMPESSEFDDTAKPGHIVPVAGSQAAGAPVFTFLRLDQLAESPHNPRKRFDPVKLQQLTESLATNGQWEPVLVRPQAAGHGVYELAAGHRRFRAAKAAGLAGLLAVIREMDDATFIELLNVSNLQREDVHPLEEADGYADMILHLHYDVPTIAAKVSKSESYIYDRLTLRSLIDPARELFFADRITTAHAVELARLTTDDQARALEPDRHKGGLWRPTGDPGFTPEEELALEDEHDADPYAGLAPVSVREFKAWIHNHTRLNVASQHAPQLFPETVAAVQAAEEAELRVVHITHNHYVQESARDEEERTIGPRSWKRADGKYESDVCDHSVLGVIVVGPGQGEAFRVCLAKQKCRTHWGEEMREAAKRAKDRERGEAGAAPTAPREQPWERALRIAQEQRDAFAPVRATVIEALAVAIERASTKPGGPIERIIMSDRRAVDPATRKRMPRGKSPEDFMRHLAFGEVVSVGDWRAHEELPKLGKLLGVDVAKLVRAHAKGMAKGAAAAASTAPRAAKARTRKARA